MFQVPGTSQDPLLDPFGGICSLWDLGPQRGLSQGWINANNLLSQTGLSTLLLLLRRCLLISLLRVQSGAGSCQQLWVLEASPLGPGLPGSACEQGRMESLGSDPLCQGGKLPTAL